MMDFGYTSSALLITALVDVSPLPKSAFVLVWKRSMRKFDEDFPAKSYAVGDYLLDFSVPTL
jgi:hypothetical protein